MDNFAKQYQSQREETYSTDWLNSRKQKLSYIRRKPEQTALYRVVFHYHEKLEQVWDDFYSENYGSFREVVKDSFFKYLDCGILYRLPFELSGGKASLSGFPLRRTVFSVPPGDTNRTFSMSSGIVHGCARACCEKCKHSELIPLSCKSRGICPSCDTKRMLLFAEHLHEEVLEAVPHRHIVLSIPKRLRAFLRYDRRRNSCRRNSCLFQSAWSSIRKLYKQINPELSPAAVLALHSGNELQEFNPHIHGLLADGVFLPDGKFQQISLDQQLLQKLFEHQFLLLLKEQGIITETIIAQITSWKHSGFSVWLGPQIQPTDTKVRLFISEYVNKVQVKLNKIEIIQDFESLFKDELVRCYKDENTYKDYLPLDFLAQISALIPNRWEQTVRYVGWYSARSRGRRKKRLDADNVPGDNASISILAEDTEYKKNKRKSWSRLIRKVFEVDPLVCPKCGGHLSIIAVIVNPKEAKRISSHLGYNYRSPPPLNTTSKSTKTVTYVH